MVPMAATRLRTDPTNKPIAVPNLSANAALLALRNEKCLSVICRFDPACGCDAACTVEVINSVVERTHHTPDKPLYIRAKSAFAHIR